jgi:oligosaccharide repeat unit polymerase
VEHIGSAFIGIGIFVTAVWVSACFRPWRVSEIIVRSVSREFTSNTYFVLSFVAFIIGMLRFAIACSFNPIEMFYWVGQNRWAAPWVRGQIGGWDAFLDHLQYFGYLLPALTAIIARRVGWYNVRTVLSSGLTLIMAIFLAQNGGRRIIGVIFGMAIILWILTQKRLRVRHILILGIALGVLLVSLQVMLEYRNVGLGALFQQKEAEAVLIQEHLRVDDNFYRMCQVIQFIPESYPYVYHKYLIYVFVRPIPRVFWPGKPIDPGFDLSSALGDKGVTYSCSVIGELYISAGFFGIALGGFLYGRLSSMVNQLLTQGRTLGAFLIYSAFSMALFSGMRSMLELVLVSYVVLAWVGLSRAYAYLFLGKKANALARRLQKALR